jgi:branched-subunit amino acid aminotransferase/4-amino-4-deoxychorismate lyase
MSRDPTERGRAFLDAAATTAPQLYETIRVREGRIPFLAEHLARLAAGAAAIGISVPAGLGDRIRAAAGSPELVLRVTIGASAESIEPRAVPSQRLVRAIVAAVPHTPYRVKTTHREAFDRARAQAVERGADEALLLTPEGYLAEGSISAVAFWRGGLRLPAAGLGILPSIGRARLIALAAELGSGVTEGKWSTEDWVGYPLFLVNSVRGMTEVETLDGQPLPRVVESAELVSRFWPSTL